MNKEVQAYNDSQSGEEKKICELLCEQISGNLADEENKVWHGAPVWFIDGNPIAGYDVLKAVSYTHLDVYKRQYKLWLVLVV